MPAVAICAFLMSFSSRSLISVLTCATLLDGCGDDSSSSMKPVFKAPSSTAQQSSVQTATQADAASPSPETTTREESSSPEETTSSVALVSPEVPADVRAKIWNGGAVPKLGFTKTGLLSEGKFVDSSIGPGGPSAELVGFNEASRHYPRPPWITSAPSRATLTAMERLKFLQPSCPPVAALAVPTRRWSSIRLRRKPLDQTPSYAPA